MSATLMMSRPEILCKCEKGGIIKIFVQKDIPTDRKFCLKAGRDASEKTLEGYFNELDKVNPNDPGNINSREIYDALGAVSRFVEDLATNDVAKSVIPLS
jgi:hypothetical protein